MHRLGDVADTVAGKDSVDALVGANESGPGAIVIAPFSVIRPPAVAAVFIPAAITSGTASMLTIAIADPNAQTGLQGSASGALNAIGLSAALTSRPADRGSQQDDGHVRRNAQRARRHQRRSGLWRTAAAWRRLHTGNLGYRRDARQLPVQHRPGQLKRGRERPRCGGWAQRHCLALEPDQDHLLANRPRRHRHGQAHRARARNPAPAGDDHRAARELIATVTRELAR